MAPRKHILEYRFVKGFPESLGKENSQACNRLNQTYKAWAKTNTFSGDGDTSCYDQLQRALGSRVDTRGLFILEHRLDGIKTQVSGSFVPRIEGFI
jgi:hypothetical protein